MTRITSMMSNTKRVVGVIVRSGRKHNLKDVFMPYKLGEATVYHALVVIFLEFFAWGLLTTPMITVLDETFPTHTFLMNGLIVGIKGILSFLSAPLIGSLSDQWGRKFFLLLAVFFTCCPIPLMRINTWWYFAMISISGIFSVTFSIVFAYVADVTTEQERSSAYGLVSATFAASLVTSPALGAYLSHMYSDSLVIFLATLIAIIDVLFVIFFVPESLPEKLRPLSVSLWEHADPFASMRKVGKDRMILLICIAVFLSYLPEAGQYSCFFVYLRLVIGFSAEDVALFIAVVGLLSVISQTAVLAGLMKSVGNRNTIVIGLLLAMVQQLWYGFGSQRWMMWCAGAIAAVSSLTYPALSTYVSTYADADKQGLVQGMITGIRGLCNGLGPAVFGLIFQLFNVDISHGMVSQFPNQGDGGAIVGGIGSYNGRNGTGMNLQMKLQPMHKFMPGPPFVFGAFLVFLAVLVTSFIPDIVQYHSRTSSSSVATYPSKARTSPSRTGSASNYYYTNIHHQKSDTSVSLYPVVEGKLSDNSNDDDCANNVDIAEQHVSLAIRSSPYQETYRKRPVDTPLMAEKHLH